MTRRFTAVLALLAAASSALAHEFWIQPVKFAAVPKETVGLRLMVGDGFPGEARPRDPRKLVKFFALGPTGEMPIPGSDGNDPAGEFAATAPGVYVLGYRSNHSRVTLDAAKFEAYLKDEGLDAAITERAKLGESSKDGKEAYSRCAKSIIAVAPANASTSSTADASNLSEGFDRVLGMPLEIVPVTNPLSAVAGSTLMFRVLHDGKPLANALVNAFAQGENEPAVQVRTNAQGHADLKLDKPGIWLIGTVNMTRASADVAAKNDADWESLWASLTFELKPAPMSDATAAAPAKP
jgi:uncharacterized GH25 family protein